MLKKLNDALLYVFDKIFEYFVAIFVIGAFFAVALVIGLRDETPKTLTKLSTDDKGCSVYRFYDTGNYRYYVACAGGAWAIF